jgi:hypothetical protein
VIRDDEENITDRGHLSENNVIQEHTHKKAKLGSNDNIKYFGKLAVCRFVQ